MKKKLVSGIMTGIFALTALVVGVYALVKVGMTFSGGVGFNPAGVYVELSGQLYRGKDFDSLEDIHDNKSYTYEKQTNYSETGTKSITGWKADNVLFTPLYRHIQYRVTVKNLSNEDISVIPSEIQWLNGNTSDNLNVIEEASATLRIPAGEARDYKLNFVLTDTAQDFSNKDWGITLNILKTSDIQTPADSYFSMSGTQLQSLTSSGYSTTQFGNRVLRVPDKVGSNQVLSTKTGTESDYTFKNLNSATKYVILPKGLTTLGNNSFNGRGMSAIGLANNLKSLEQDSIRDCPQLASIDIPEGVTKIAEAAFYNSTGLVSARIPSTVTDIGFTIFGYCRSLALIEVDEANANYASFGGSLYSKDKKTLIRGAAKVVVDDIVDGVETVTGDAFAGCTSLKSVTLPSSVKSIGEAVFYSCASLASIVIPQNITYIPPLTFQNCSSLKYIKMSGQTLSSAYTLPSTTGKVWVYSANATKPTSWASYIVAAIPASATSYYYHNQAAY